MPSRDAQPEPFDTTQPYIDRINTIHDSKAAAIYLSPKSTEAISSNGKRHGTHDHTMSVPVTRMKGDGVTE
jgi:hypothetical protein